MKVELDEKDIIQEVSKNFPNDTTLLWDIIDKSTTTWEPFKKLTKRMLQALKVNGELDVEELLSDN